LGFLNFFRLPYRRQVPSKHYPPREPVATVCAVSQIGCGAKSADSLAADPSTIAFANLVTFESKSRRIADRP